MPTKRSVPFSSLRMPPSGMLSFSPYEASAESSLMGAIDENVDAGIKPPMLWTSLASVASLSSRTPLLLTEGLSKRSGFFGGNRSAMPSLVGSRFNPTPTSTLPVNSRTNRSCDHM